MLNYQRVYMCEITGCFFPKPSCFLEAEKMLAVSYGKHEKGESLRK
jgi:hypothetical protein